MGQSLNLFSRDVVKLQKTLISEEFQELIEALYLTSDDLRNKRAREEALKELADLVYVCYQLAAGGSTCCVVETSLLM